VNAGLLVLDGRMAGLAAAWSVRQGRSVGADTGGLYVRTYAGGLAAALVCGLRAARTAAESGTRPFPVRTLVSGSDGA
jgi:hypothetical protein